MASGGGQQGYQSHLFGVPSKQNYGFQQPAPQMYSSRGPGPGPGSGPPGPGNNLSVGDPAAFVHHDWYNQISPWALSSPHYPGQTGAYRDPGTDTEWNWNRQGVESGQKFLYGPRNPRVGRGPPRGSAPNAPPGAYGAWSPYAPYAPPNPFVSGGYENYFDPYWASGGGFDPNSFQGDPYIGPGGGRVGWDPLIQNYLDQFGHSNYTMQSIFNPLWNAQFDIDRDLDERWINEEGELVGDIGALVLSEGDIGTLGSLYGDYAEAGPLNIGSWYDVFPQYYDETRVDAEGEPSDLAGYGIVEESGDWLVPWVNNDARPWQDSPYGQFGEGWSMAPGVSGDIATMGGTENWYSRPLGLTTTYGPEHIASNFPQYYTDPELMINRPFEEYRHYGLGYGLGYGEDRDIYAPIEGVQGVGDRYSEDFQPYLFQPGGTAVYGGPGSEYPFRSIEEWRRLAAGDEWTHQFITSGGGSGTPANLFGDPSGAGFTGQEWGTLDDPLATSAWANIYGGGHVGPTTRLMGDPEYDWLQFESDEVGTQGYGGDPGGWAPNLGGTFSQNFNDPNWMIQELLSTEIPEGGGPEDSVPTENAFRLWNMMQTFAPAGVWTDPGSGSATTGLNWDWGELDVGIGTSGEMTGLGPMGQYQKVSNFFRSHIQSTHNQIYDDGVFPDTYDQDLRMTTDMWLDDDSVIRTTEGLAIPAWMMAGVDPSGYDELRKIHPAAGKAISELTDSERADLETIIGSEGDYSNWSPAVWQAQLIQNIPGSPMYDDPDGQIIWGEALKTLLTGGVGTRSGTSDPMAGVGQNIFSLSGLTELSEATGLNYYRGQVAENRQSPMGYSSGSLATGLESTGIGTGSIAGRVDPDTYPWMGSVADYQNDISNYLTDYRNPLMVEPTNYGVVSDDEISLPPWMLSAAQDTLFAGLTPNLGGAYGTGPGYGTDIFQEVASAGNLYPSELSDFATGSLFGMGGDSSAQGTGYMPLNVGTQFDPGGAGGYSYPLILSMMAGGDYSLGRSNIPGAYDDTILPGILSGLKAGSDDLSVWGGGHGLPEWMSEVPAASAWRPYEPGRPNYLTRVGEDTFASQLLTTSGIGRTPGSEFSGAYGNFGDNVGNFNFFNLGGGGMPSGYYSIPGQQQTTWTVGGNPITVDMPMYADGGSVGSTPEYASETPSSDLIDMTVSALMGEAEKPDEVVKEFTEKYGPEALPKLVEDILSGGNGDFLRGPGDGKADDVPGLIDGIEPVFLSSGEYVVPADVVKSMGNGSPDEGAKELMGMVDDIRLASNGR